MKAGAFMPQMKSWDDLKHEERVQALASSPITEIAVNYEFGGRAPKDVTDLLERERTLWVADNVGEFETAGNPPTKETLLELIDNSIDIWRSRRAQYPDRAAKELRINIDIDKPTRRLTYEDNAGGVHHDRLANLVLPGYSDTDALAPTIGSYKTGGKKAVFRLATDARIDTRYLDPAGGTDEAITVQLDSAWMKDPLEYHFPYAKLKEKTAIERGNTRYVLQLRDEPPGGTFWGESAELTGRITSEIRQTYSLLLIRHPIRIYFLDRSAPLTPDEKLFDFSSTSDGATDIRPQRVDFILNLPYEGAQREVIVEIVLGCRTSTGSTGSLGIDLYGNDRLFVQNDADLAPDLLPVTGRRLVRGYINIRGPNVFIPWDTHKRHLNLDRDIITLLKTNKVIGEMFANWSKAYNEISRGDVTKLIGSPVPHIIDKRAADLAIPKATISIDPGKKRGVALPKDLFVPHVTPGKNRQRPEIKLTIPLSDEEARLLGSFYKIEGSTTSSRFADDLAKELKTDALKRAKRK